MKPPLACLVTWPTGPTGSPALDAVAQPHSCALAANHVHGKDPVPHRCLCGSSVPVRDIEPAEVTK